MNGDVLSSIRPRRGGAAAARGLFTGKLVITSLQCLILTCAEVNNVLE